MNQSEVNGNPCTAEEARGRDRPDRRRGGKEQRLKHHRRRSDARYEQWPRRPDSHGDDAADDGADSARCEDGGPRTRPAEVLRCDERPQHEQRGEREVADPEEEHRRPQPGMRRELGPALAELAEGLRPRSARRGTLIRARSPAHAKNVRASTPSAAPGCRRPRAPRRARGRGRRRRCARRPWRRSPAAAAPG